MKGPSLQYALRGARLFRCLSCGREVPATAQTTTLLCTCSDPPKFMRPVDRGPAPIPDVSAFISPPDPADLIEEELDESAWVPYVPVLPPKPVRYPGRRKLTDEIEKYQPEEFGAGLESGTQDRDADAETQERRTSELPETGARRPDRQSSSGDRRDSRRHRDRQRNRPRSERDQAQGPSNRPAPSRPAQRPLSPSTAEQTATPAEQPAGENVSADPETPSGTNSADSNRPRHRRRGRRRGRGPDGSPAGAS